MKEIPGSDGILLPPSQLRDLIKDRAKEYLAWLRKSSNIDIPEDKRILHSKYDFVFKDEYRSNIISSQTNRGIA